MINENFLKSVEDSKEVGLRIEDSDLSLDLQFASTEEALNYILGEYVYGVVTLDLILVAFVHYGCTLTEEADKIARNALSWEEYCIIKGMLQALTQKKEG